MTTNNYRHEDTMTDTTRTRTITLTNRRPVRITDHNWPILAKAEDDSYHGDDYGRHQQALALAECDTYRLIVRQHADGRTLVYGILDAAIGAWHAPAAGESWRGGELLDTGADLAMAIRRVGESGNLPDSLIRECIASLPAEDL